MIVERQPVHILDLASEPAYLERHPGRVATVEIGGARTFLAVPMFRRTSSSAGSSSTVRTSGRSRMSRLR